MLHNHAGLPDGLRQRGGTTTAASTSDLDSILQHHQQQQEKLAEDMVNLAKNMKDHAKVSSRIVQDDNKVRVIVKFHCCFEYRCLCYYTN